MDQPTAPVLEADEDYTTEQLAQRMAEDARQAQAAINELGAGKPEPEPTGPEPITQVTLTFLSDGGIHMGVGGELKPAVVWAMGEFLRNVGDDLFLKARMAAEAARAAQDPAARIVVPGQGLRPIPR